MDFSALNPSTTNALNVACRLNKIDVVRKLLRNGRNPNYVDNRGWTALHEAAAYDSFECLKELLAHEATRPLAESFEGHTALFLACKRNVSTETIMYLLENVEEIAEFCSNENLSPLHVVSGNGRVDIAEALINEDSKLDLQDFDGDTALHEAARKNHPDIVSMLLHAGADAEIRNSYGLTPFLLACFKGNIECVKELFPFIVDVNDCATDGNTSLILASQSGSLDLVKFLLANGADPNLKNSDDCLASYMALIVGHTSIFRHLLLITKVNLITKDIINSVCNPLYFSTSALLALFESDLSPQFFNQNEAFHVIAEKTFGIRLNYKVGPPFASLLNVIEYIYYKSNELSEKLILLMLTKGVSVNSLSKDECPPLVYLHLCKYKACHEQVINILVEHDCDIDYSTTPLVDGLQIPDVVVISSSNHGHSLPVLIQFIHKLDPEDIILLLMKHDMIGKKVRLEIFSMLMNNCWFPSKVLEGLSKQVLTNCCIDGVLSDSLKFALKPRPAVLKHMCRRAVRSTLRKHNFTTQKFIKALKELPIPHTVQSYLRYL